MLAFSFSAPAKNIARSDVSYKKKHKVSFWFLEVMRYLEQLRQFHQEHMQGLDFPFS